MTMGPSRQHQFASSTPEQRHLSPPISTESDDGTAFRDTPNYYPVASLIFPGHPDTNLLTPNSASGSPNCRDSPTTRHYPTPPTAALGSFREASMYTNQNGFNFEPNALPDSAASPRVELHDAISPQHLQAPPPYYGGYAASHSESLPPNHMHATQHDYGLQMGLHPSHTIPSIDRGTPLPSTISRYSTPQPASNFAYGPSSASFPWPQETRGTKRRLDGAGEHPTTINYRQPSADSAEDTKHVSRTTNNSKRRRQSEPKSRKQNEMRRPPFTNCDGVEAMPTIKQSCPEDDRFLMELRWKHRSLGGENMWQTIQYEYNNRPGPESKASAEKERLQMKFRRARNRWMEWNPRDEEILRQAWWDFEKERYTMIMDKFLAAGGSNNMFLNPVDIEAKIVELKLESDMYILRRSDGDNGFMNPWDEGLNEAPGSSQAWDTRQRVDTRKKGNSKKQEPSPSFSLEDLGQLAALRDYEDPRLAEERSQRVHNQVMSRPLSGPF